MAKGAGRLFRIEHLGSNREGTGSLFQVTDTEQAPIFSWDYNNISGMGMFESYVSSYHCVGSLSYKPNNGRDGGVFRIQWGTCKGVWQHAGRGRVWAEKELRWTRLLTWACLGIREKGSDKSSLLHSFAAPIQCVFQRTHRGKKSLFKYLFLSKPTVRKGKSKCLNILFLCPEAPGSAHRLFLTLTERKPGGCEAPLLQRPELRNLYYSKSCSPYGLHFRK